MPSIYKITYPNGKIYIGSDLTDTLLYFGSPEKVQIIRDHTPTQYPFIIQKEILWGGTQVTRSDLLKKEMELIIAFESNNPERGYNRIPIYKRKRCKP